MANAENSSISDFDWNEYLLAYHNLQLKFGNLFNSSIDLAAFFEYKDSTESWLEKVQQAMASSYSMTTQELMTLWEPMQTFLEVQNLV